MIKWVTFYKTYRDIIISDIVHIRRPDLQASDLLAATAMQLMRGEWAGLRQLHACESDAAEPRTGHGLQPNAVCGRTMQRGAAHGRGRNAISKNITLPLYYTGLTETALIQEQVWADNVCAVRSKHGCRRVRRRFTRCRASTRSMCCCRWRQW